MSDEPKTKIVDKVIERSAVGVPKTFKRHSQTAHVLDWIIRHETFTGTSRDAAKTLFDSRVADSTVRQWRSGFAPMPRWAIDLLLIKIRGRRIRAETLLSQLVAGPGKAPPNILAYNARRNSAQK